MLQRVPFVTLLLRNVLMMNYIFNYRISGSTRVPRGRTTKEYVLRSSTRHGFGYRWCPFSDVAHCMVTNPNLSFSLWVI